MTIRLPLLLSMGLHGLVVAALGLVSFGERTIVETRPEIRVELVVPAPEPSLPEAGHNAAPQTPQPVVQDRPSSEQQHPSGASITKTVTSKRSFRHTSQRMALARQTAVLTAPLADRVQPAQSIPAEPAVHFMEVHSAPAATRSPVGADLIASEPQFTAAAVSLSDAGLGLPPASRPLLRGSFGSRKLLKDPSAESASAVRSNVRLGDNVRPEYPRAAREAGWEGMVMLRVEVLPDGKAGAVVVHKSSGHSVLDEAALTAVRRWRFSPAMDGNFPVGSLVHLPIKFDLTEQ